jgi:membrane protein YdbS with pleckstrin-like domain
MELIKDMLLWIVAITPVAVINIFSENIPYIYGVTSKIISLAISLTILITVIYRYKQIRKKYKDKNKVK